MTSRFVYKVMGLTFYDRINTQFIYIFELAQVVARRITKPQRNCLGSNLTGCSFFQFFFGGGGGGGADFIILFMFFFLLIYFVIIFFLVFIPLTCIRHIYKNKCNNINYCQYGIIYNANRVKRRICDIKICD